MEMKLGTRSSFPEFLISILETFMRSTVLPKREKPIALLYPVALNSSFDFSFRLAKNVGATCGLNSFLLTREMSSLQRASCACTPFLVKED